MPAAATVSVFFVWRGSPGQRVELVGDFPNWAYPVAMVEEPPGLYGCLLDLEPGVYRYKFRVNESQWVDDPQAPLVDGAEAFGNGLVVVEGATPPLLFANDRRHVGFVDDGRLVVHVELAGATDCLSLWARPTGTPPAPPLLVPFELVGTRGSHRLLRASLQLPPSMTGGTFGVDRSAQRAFELPPRRSPLDQAPAWLQGAIFYNIFVDRWVRGRASAPSPRASPRNVRSTPQVFYGGDLAGVREGLAYLLELGVDALILTPVNCAPTPHRYDAVDLMTVDPELGGEPALLALLEEAHRLGLRVVMDLAATHVNEAHPAFQDLLEKQQSSAYASWFRVLRFPVQARNGDTFDYYYDHPQLPWLDLRPGPARSHVLSAVERWVDLGVDGLRLDAMNDAPADFWAELRRTARARNPQLLLFGEIVSDNLARFAGERGVDTATDFRHREAMLAFFARANCSAQEFWDRTTFDGFRTGAFASTFRLLFLDNHDTWRFLSVANDYHRLRLALAYLLFRPEPVSINYGTEAGLAAFDFSDGGLLDEAWGERLPMPPLDAPRTETFKLLKALTALRRELLRAAGEVRLVEASEQLLVLERRHARGVVRAYFNAGEQVRDVPQVPAGSRLLLAVNETAGRADAPLGAWAARLVAVAC